MERYDALIVGGGHGGAQTAVALRQHGFAGTIAIVGEESELPYERPPLSKDYLAGAKPFERMLIRPVAFWAEREIALLSGRRVEAVDAAAHVVTLSDGATLGYATLVWAAGGWARRLACKGGDFGRVHTLRCRADADRMIAELPYVRRAVVIGGGYIGLEAAAVLVGLGKQVTVVEAAGRLLSRVAGAAISDFYAAEHRARGVDIRTGAEVDSILGEDGAARAVRLAGGELLPADMVVVGIGIEPAAGPLLAAEAAGGDGVEVDAHCRTSLPDIYAVGDCAAHENLFAGGRRIRIESVQNAHDQAVAAAKAITGAPERYAALPWFWSNQYDLRLQTVGLSHGHEEVVVRGDPGMRAFSAVYLRDGRVVALDCINAVKDYVQGRALILGGVEPDRAALADASIPLKEVAAA